MTKDLDRAVLTDLEAAAQRPESRANAGGKKTPVPMLDLSRQYAAIKDDILAAVENLCASQKYVMGPDMGEFEQRLASFCGAGSAIGCASGTDALWLGLEAIGGIPGYEVITTPFSFFASASCIVRAGGRPVFCDIDPGTLNLDPASVERRLRGGAVGRVKALIPVHLYGQCADMDAFAAIAQEFKLPILEDAAQAIGASWKGKRAGAMGAAGAFSFYPTKNLSCYGDGGALTTNDAALAERARIFRAHGSRERYYHDEIGWNSRLDSMQAAILNVKMAHLENWNKARREKACYYEKLLNGSGLLNTSSPPGDGGLADSQAPVRLLKVRPEAFHIYHQYVIRVQQRDKLRQFFSERGIGSEVYYPVPLHLQKCFTYLGYAEGDLPESERAAREVLALPIFPELRQDEQQTVVDALAEFYS